MADIRIDITAKGLIQKDKKALQKDTETSIGNILTRVATFMERTAKENIQGSVYRTPVPKIPGYSRTGKARQSIMRGVVSPLQQRVYMGVNYGQYLEEGTGIYRGRKPYWTTFGGLLDRPIKYKGMKPRPFWKPAIEETKRNIQNIVKQEFKK